MNVCHQAAFGLTKTVLLVETLSIPFRSGISVLFTQTCKYRTLVQGLTHHRTVSSLTVKSVNVMKKRSTYTFAANFYSVFLYTTKDLPWPSRIRSAMNPSHKTLRFSACADGTAKTDHSLFFRVFVQRSCLSCIRYRFHLWAPFL